MDDQLDLRYLRGRKPDVFYRCPTLESLEGALRNELQKVAQILIPEEAVAEFSFPSTSTITVPVTQQANLGALGIQASGSPQVIPVASALCPDFDGPDRLKVQRAVAKSFVELVQQIDGFRYMERQAWNKVNSDGTRFKYVCLDSLQNRDRFFNSKRYKEKAESRDSSQGRSRLPTYDCGGAIHIKFSLERDAINVIYRHNPIHRDTSNRTQILQHFAWNTQQASFPPQHLPTPSIEFPAAQRLAIEESTDEALPPPPPKRRHRSRAENEARAAREAQRAAQRAAPPPPKRRHRSRAENEARAARDAQRAALTLASTERSHKSRTNKPNRPPTSASPTSTRNPATHTSSTNHTQSKRHVQPTQEAFEAVHSQTSRPKAKLPCQRCRFKKLKCDEGKPSCNNCLRASEFCGYPEKTSYTRFKTGCLTCRHRKRKCGEEQPICSYCLKVGADCEYPGTP